MKTDKGERKLTVNRASAIYLFAGLIVSLVAAGYFKLDTAVCVQAFGIYTAGIVGKDSAFVWGNSKEHAAASTGKPVSPST